MLGLIAVAKMENSPELFNDKYVESLQISALKLDRTLHKLLEKYTIQKQEISYDTFSGQAVYRLLETSILPNLLGLRKNDLEVTLEGELNFETDSKLLSIIISNLLENAFIYSKKAENKKVELKIRQGQGLVSLCVSDYGPGIKPELREKIFNMFFRGNESSTGNGLGLYLVKAAVEKLNGKVKLEIEEGKYTRFTVTIPEGQSQEKPSLFLSETSGA